MKVSVFCPRLLLLRLLRSLERESDFRFLRQQSTTTNYYFEGRKWHSYDSQLGAPVL